MSDRTIPLSIPSSLADVEAAIQATWGEAPDLVVCRLQSQQLQRSVLLVYLDSLVDKNSIHNNVLQPLLFEQGTVHTPADLAVLIGQQKQTTLWCDVEDAIFQGKSVVFIEGEQKALILDTQGWPQRAIEEPQVESSLKGSHQGFIETGGQNIALIRRYLPNRELQVRELTVGRRGKTKVSLLYLRDVSSEEALQELERRIGQLNIDAIINTGELMQLIEDHPFSPFPQFLLTERPDAAVRNLLQGRIVAVVDRSPSVMIGPMSFISFFQTTDDYGTRWIIASFLRLLRMLAFFVAIFLPSLYIATISFHYELLPLNLILTVGESREQVPLPPILEAILMELAIEMLREAGLRLPAPIGQTVGIVGGVVIGQAAVQAGLVSNIMVVIVAITAISSFIIPNPDMSESVRIIRFPMMIVASLFGVVGMAIGLMILVIHLAGLQSLGAPFGSPFAPVRFRDWKDTFVRFPIWAIRWRPFSARPIQLRRQAKTRK